MMPRPAPTPSCPPLPNPVAVVGPQFCVPYPVDLIFTKKLALDDGTFDITDVNGNVMFQIKGTILSLRGHRVLVDDAGQPIISFQQKMLTKHRQWQVFRGDSSNSKDLLFIVKECSWIQLQTKLDVHLAANKDKDTCDFKCVGNWAERSCTIYLGDGSTTITQMHRETGAAALFTGKYRYGVTVYPNADYAFIAALVAILHETRAAGTGYT